MNRLEYDYHECPQGGTMITTQFTTEDHDPLWAEVKCSTCGMVLKPCGTSRVWIEGRPYWATAMYTFNRKPEPTPVEPTKEEILATLAGVKRL